MSQPLIAIVGSADAHRDPGEPKYDPPLKDIATAHEAAEAIGVELANQGCRLIVYGSSPAIEDDVVRGFASVCRSEKQIEVRRPRSAAGRFPEADKNGKLFHDQPTADDKWQASYYRSLGDADGVVMIGGADTTFITGHLAISQRKAILAVEPFGGAASRIWASLIPGQDLVTEDERRQMAFQSWCPEYANELVSGLLAQHQRRQQELKRQQEASMLRSLRHRGMLAVALYVIVTGMVAWSVILTSNQASIEFEGVPKWLPLFLLCLIGPLAGAAGAITRSVWKPSDSNEPVATFAKGFMAGATASVLYLLAQMATVAQVTQISPVAMFIALAIGLLAGFTFDKVFTRMAETDVRIDAPTAAAGRGAARLSPRLRPGKER